jgi:hypothetical protein
MDIILSKVGKKVFIGRKWGRYNAEPIMLAEEESMHVPEIFEQIKAEQMAMEYCLESFLDRIFNRN